MIQHSPFFPKATLKKVSGQVWDYRWEDPPRRGVSVLLTPPPSYNLFLCPPHTHTHLARYECHKKIRGDTSVMTYFGHSVKNTLIRCKFSPAFTTGQVNIN